MSAVADLREAALGVVRRDALLFWSYRLRMVSQTFALFFSLTLFYYVSRLISVAAFPTPDTYFAYVAVGIVVLTLLTGTLTALPLAVRHELVAGTFERFVASPTGALAGIVAMLVFPMLSALVMSVVQLLLAGAVFGIPIEWSTAALAIPIGLLALLSFAPFALLMAATVVMFKQVSGGVTFVTTGLAFVSGFFFPPSLLPGWIEWASAVQPLTPALDLLRHFVVGTQLTDPAVESLAKVAFFAAVLLPPSTWFLRAAIERCRVRGTLLEY